MWDQIKVVPHYVLNSEEVEAEVGGISRERSSVDKGRELVWMQKLLERRARL